MTPCKHIGEKETVKICSIYSNYWNQRNFPIRKFS